MGVINLTQVGNVNVACHSRDLREIERCGDGLFELTGLHAILFSSSEQSSTPPHTHVHTHIGNCLIVKAPMV